ncbi:class I adenylate-forming enzyme family protein [Robiginitomaculum antarcticum]|uniref:class I adenylate-forming enzyme family protein n=1 Tax=Robiginitomaculum antarcticum TaxID=437507 RepID=UPI00036E402F|nr:class I adenylate-forming enzyme family protein [Robiginitomaculum antarcticum]
MSKIIQPTNPLLPDIFALHGKWRADKPALIASGESQTWHEFTQRMNQVANGLASKGMRKGDRVALLMTNGSAMAECLFGAMMGGFVSAPLNISVTDDAIINMIIDSGAKAIICTEDQAERIDDMLDKLPKSIKHNRVCTGESRKDWTPYSHWRDAQSPYRPDVKIAPDDFLNIIYSSGTTGQPKGIVHTHQGRRDWAYDLAITLRYDSSARFLATIGLYSNITWVGMLCTLLSGGTLLINEKFDADAIWKRIETDRITHLSMVPVMYERMMESPQRRQFKSTSMRGMMSAGSPLREPVKAALFEHFDCGVIELYGLTEGVITTLDPEDAPQRLASVGLPLIGTDIKILDDADNECPAGTAGEIVSCGRIVMPEYFGRKEATQEAVWIDSHGVHWLRTGDIGYLDDEGYLYIVDRKKDMILSGGQNIYPQDIEAVIIQHPDVGDVAVIGVISRKWGETPLALVALKNGSGKSDEIRVWANTRLGKQQRITGLEFIDEIPRNPNGKILKRELRKTYKGRVFD